jgi:HSP20 family protein
MKLTRWTPTRGLIDFRTEMDRLFEDLVGEAGPAPTAGWIPAADLKESDDGFTVRLDLPGVDKKDVKVSVHDDVVTIRGERKQEKAEQNQSWHRNERIYGLFERSFRLGVPLDPSRVKATYQSGVLTVSVPKAESSKPREIEIEVAG